MPVLTQLMPPSSVTPMETMASSARTSEAKFSRAFLFSGVVRRSIGILHPMRFVAFVIAISTRSLTRASIWEKTLLLFGRAYLSTISGSSTPRASLLRTPYVDRALSGKNVAPMVFMGKPDNGVP